MKTALRIAVALVLFAGLVIGTSFAIVAGVDKLASRDCGTTPTVTGPAPAPQSPEVRPPPKAPADSSRYTPRARQFTRQFTSQNRNTPK